MAPPGPAPRGNAFRSAERAADFAEGPLISVVVAAYNAAATIAETLESLQQQTCPTWEAICVDDGSTDETAEIIARYAGADSRFRALFGRHAGTGAAKHRGFGAARGAWVMVLDADDRLRPEAIGTLQRIIEKCGDNVLIMPGHELVDAEGRPLDRFSYWQRRRLSPEALLESNCVSPNTLIPRALCDPPPFQPGLDRCVDWAAWFQLARHRPDCIAVRRALIEYRLHRGSVSHQADQMVRAAECVLVREGAGQPPALLERARLLIACSYGFVAFAGGDREALVRYLGDRSRDALDESLTAPLAARLRWAFEFVHGQSGATWSTHGTEWTAAIEGWLAETPLQRLAESVLTALAARAADPNVCPPELLTWLAGRPNLRRLVIYGLGHNGAQLLDKLRRIAPHWLPYTAVADDHADTVTFAAQGLPRVRPERWTRWPSGTCVICTPNDDGQMVTRLEALGGERQADFWRLACGAPELVGGSA